MSQPRYFIVRDAAVELPQECREWASCPTLVMQADEEHKSLSELQRIWNFLIDNNATRSDILVNIGGGCISDIGGLAASMYRRGMRYINVPTTLLSMVDASIGGKTGINYRGLKNHIGLIRQPMEVRLYPAFLRTLPARELLSGFAELLKTALLDAPSAVNEALVWIDDWAAQGLTDELLERLETMIRRAAACKERYVAADREDNDIRHALNSGHTVGHALEEIHIGALPHGYAVMYGMVAALYLSVVQQGLDRRLLQQFSALMVAQYGRPECRCRDYDRLMALMHKDKKNEDAENISFVLLPTVGQPMIRCGVSEALLREALDYLFSC